MRGSSCDSCRKTGHWSTSFCAPASRRRESHRRENKLALGSAQGTQTFIISEEHNNVASGENSALTAQSTRVNPHILTQ